MYDVKITVIKALTVDDLIERYAPEDFPVCPNHHVGQEFLSERGQKPQGFCEEAWAAISRYAFALAHGVEGFWESWIPERGISINSCNDGLRPVIFKLEQVEASS